MARLHELGRGLRMRLMRTKGLLGLLCWQIRLRVFGSYQWCYVVDKRNWFAAVSEAQDGILVQFIYEHREVTGEVFEATVITEDFPGEFWESQDGEYEV